MNVAVINVDCGTGGSTGRIALEIVKEDTTEKDAILFAYGREGGNDERIKKYKVGNRLSIYTHVLLTRFFDLHCHGSYFATKKLVKALEEFHPDILWLHNIHGYYINMGVLFEWIKFQHNMKVNWLLHDCWAFTGHCGYFTVAKCDKWEKGCYQCVQKKEYPKSILFDNSKRNYICKKKTFTGIKNLTIITPSQWLADLVAKSFLKGYPVRVRHNTIDTKVFSSKTNHFKSDYKIEEKFVVLGVANIWNKRKGLNDFLRLRKYLDERFIIVLVGLQENQIKQLPKGIIGIKRTQSANKLAEVYSAADVFFNPTYEDNYPTVNLEAESCGTPVITYDTGGSKETLHSNESRVVETGNLMKVVQLIQEMEK